MAAICCCPPLSVPTRWSAKLAAPKAANPLAGRAASVSIVRALAIFAAAVMGRSSINKATVDR